MKIPYIKILSIFSLWLIFSCNEKIDHKNEDFKPEDTTTQLSYHDSYLREISFIQTRKDSAATTGMLKIKGGKYMMGGLDSLARKDEFPRHAEKVPNLWVDEHEVTNAQFREFVEATGYVTTAERSFEIKGKKYEPGALVFDPANPDWWWKFVKGANWMHPTGNKSSIEGKDELPVVQVSWYDAMAYAKWANKRLPTEAEYEYFNRGGLKDSIYNWGNNDSIAPKMANYFQGEFPFRNDVEDSFANAAPVKSFPANTFGLYDTAGNVWEWCLDTYHPDAYYQLSKRQNGYFSEFSSMDQEKVIRGGSFLCNKSYCSGYRNSARMFATPDTGLEHTGFRCVRDL